MNHLLKKSGLIFIAFGVLVSASLTSCLNKDNGELPEPIPVAYVSFFHSSPNAPALDIRVDDKAFNTQAFNYSDYYGYNRFYTGNRNIKISPSNASNVFADTTVNLKADKIYSVFLTNEVPDLLPLIVEDSWPVPLAGKAIIRVVHLSPDAPAVDMEVDNNTSKFVEGLSAKNASTFAEITAGTHSFHFKSTDGSVLLVSAPDLNIKEKRIYTLVIRGYATPPAGNSNSLSVQLITNHSIL